MADLPLKTTLQSTDTTNAEMKTALGDWRDFTAQLPGAAAESELTIASGQVTATAAAHTIDTESDAASDDLDNMLTTNMPDGSLVLLRAQDASRVPTIKHESGGAGQFHLKAAADLDLDGTDRVLLVQRRGADWYEVALFTAATTTVPGTMRACTDAEAAAMTASNAAMTPAAFGAVARYDWIWIPAAAWTPATTNGPESATVENATYKHNADVLKFDGSTQEYATHEFPMPKVWDRGPVKFKVDWDGDTGASAADTVEWKLEAVAVGNDDVRDAAWGTGQVISDALLAVGDRHLTDVSPALTVGGSPALGDLVQWRLSRNVSGTDDMTEDAILHGVWVQWKVGNTVAAE